MSRDQDSFVDFHGFRLNPGFKVFQEIILGIDFILFFIQDKIASGKNQFQEFFPIFGIVMNYCFIKKKSPGVVIQRQNPGDAGLPFHQIHRYIFLV